MWSKGCDGETMLRGRKVHAKNRAQLAGAVIEWLERRRLLATTVITLPAAPRDVVFDKTHNILYATASNGTLARYDVASKTLLSAWTVGGAPNGLDITSNDSAIYIADGTTVGTQGFFKKVNLATGAVSSIAYTRAAFENGTFDVAISSNCLAFGTTSGNSTSVPFHQIDTTTDTITTRAFNPVGGLIGANTIINRGADRSLLVFQQPSISTGPISLYRASPNDFVHKNTYNTIGTNPSAVSPAADRVARMPP